MEFFKNYNSKYTRDFVILDQKYCLFLFFGGFVQVFFIVIAFHILF